MIRDRTWLGRAPAPPMGMLDRSSISESSSSSAIGYSSLFIGRSVRTKPQCSDLRRKCSMCANTSGSWMQQDWTVAGIVWPRLSSRPNEEERQNKHAPPTPRGLVIVQHTAPNIPLCAPLSPTSPSWCCRWGATALALIHATSWFHGLRPSPLDASVLGPQSVVQQTTKFLFIYLHVPATLLEREALEVLLVLLSDVACVLVSQLDLLQQNR